MLSNSSILITGGTGSFGHAFVPMTLKNIIQKGFKNYWQTYLRLLMKRGELATLQYWLLIAKIYRIIWTQRYTF